MLFVSGLFYLLVLDGRLGFGDGLLLCGCLAVFLYRCLRSRRRPVPAPTSADAAPSRRGRDLLLVAAGMVGLGIGAELMVRSAVTLARGWGVSELVIGLTVVAVGTSLPELAASLVGAMRGAADISVGNVLGSNIFNIGFVLGICPLLRPVAVAPGLLRLELPAMLLFSALLLPLAARSLRLGRMQGALLLAGYVGFVLLLFLRGS